MGCRIIQKISDRDYIQGKVKHDVYLETLRVLVKSRRNPDIGLQKCKDIISSQVDTTDLRPEYEMHNRGK